MNRLLYPWGKFSGRKFNAYFRWNKYLLEKNIASGEEKSDIYKIKILEK